MKSRNFAILLGVLGILVVLYLIQNLGSSKKTVSESFVDLYPDLNSSSVIYIKAYKQGYPDSGLAFAKKDGSWIVQSYYNAPAKEGDVEKLFTDLKQLQGEIRSSKSELFADYEIGDSVALHLELIGPDSTNIAHILFGKGVPQASRSSFIRNFESDTVYMANENFISRFAAWNAEPAKRLPAKRWIELKLADFDKDSVKTIELKDSRNTYLFEKHDELVKEDTIETTKSVWAQVKPTKDKLDDKKINDLLGRIGSLRGMDIVGVTVEPEHKLNDPRQVVTVTTNDGQTYGYAFGAPADTASGARFLKIDGKPYIYTVAKYNYESIFVNPFKKD